MLIKDFLVTPAIPPQEGQTASHECPPPPPPPPNNNNNNTGSGGGPINSGGKCVFLGYADANQHNAGTIVPPGTAIYLCV